MMLLLHVAHIMCTSHERIKTAAIGQSNTSFTLLPLGQSVLFTTMRICEILPVCLNTPNL